MAEEIEAFAERITVSLSVLQGQFLQVEVDGETLSVHSIADMLVVFFRCKIRSQLHEYWVLYFFNVDPFIVICYTKL